MNAGRSDRRPRRTRRAREARPAARASRRRSWQSRASPSRSPAGTGRSSPPAGAGRRSPARPTGCRISVVIAAAVLRSSAPSASPNSAHPRSGRAAEPNTARSDARVRRASKSLLAKIALPAKNAGNARDRAISTSVTATNTPSFAHSTGSRRGTAASVARIIPVAYSPVTAITPSTPNASCARKMPPRLRSTASRQRAPVDVPVAQSVDGQPRHEHAEADHEAERDEERQLDRAQRVQLDPFRRSTRACVTRRRSCRAPRYSTASRVSSMNASSSDARRGVSSCSASPSAARELADRFGCSARRPPARPARRW